MSKSELIHVDNNEMRNILSNHEGALKAGEKQTYSVYNAGIVSGYLLGRGLDFETEKSGDDTVTIWLKPEHVFRVNTEIRVVRCENPVCTNVGKTREGGIEPEGWITLNEYHAQKLIGQNFFCSDMCSLSWFTGVTPEMEEWAKERDDEMGRKK